MIGKIKAMRNAIASGDGKQIHRATFALYEEARRRHFNGDTIIREFYLFTQVPDHTVAQLEEAMDAYERRICTQLPPASYIPTGMGRSLYPRRRNLNRPGYLVPQANAVPGSGDAPTE